MSTQEVIPVSAISGFPEFTPAERIEEIKMLDTIRQGFERFGFSSIETSAIERKEVLTAKTGGDVSRQIYGLHRLAAGEGEDASTELALHFDLTVPLARYVAQNYGKLTFPFRRYQMQKVWRGERPQLRRFREFLQCDIDIIGDGELSLMADAEIPAVIYNIFSRLNFGGFLIRINNRKIPVGFFASLGVKQDQIVLVLREVDKIERNGIDRVAEQLGSIGLSREVVERIVEFVTFRGTNHEVLSHLQEMGGINELFERGVEELVQVVQFSGQFGIPETNLSVDPSITRDLDYYTGTIYETRFVDHTGVGSICSGGRFDDLAGLFIDRHLPGVGISIGATRLFSELLGAGIVQPQQSSTATVLVATPDQDTLMPQCIEIITMLRNAGVDAELFTEKQELSRQLRFASQKGIPAVVIPLAEDLKKGEVRFRDMRHGNQFTVSRELLAQEILKFVSGKL